jgi:hypothetical protein
MNRFRFTVKVLAIAIFMFAFASLAQAQAQHTWVSGVGDDANPCSRTAPCKTFAGAISKTAVFGAIQCLDPGGFGAVTITKSISILCEEETGFMSIPAGNGINVNLPNATDRVTLRGLTIDGFNTGTNAINFIGLGSLHVQEVNIRGFAQNGINFAPSSGLAQLFVSSDCVITDSNGGNFAFAAILIKPISGANANVSITGVQLSHNTNGIFADASGGGGISNFTVKNSVISGNSNAGVVVATSGAVAFSGIVDSSMISLNNFGVAIAGSAATLRLGGNTISHNATGVSNSGGTLESFKNNQVVANLTNGTPIPAVSVSGNILN